MKQLIIRKAAVIGAGIMGSGIAAHLANAGIPTHLLDIVPESAKDSKDPRQRSSIAAAAIQKQIKSRICGFYDKKFAQLIKPGNLEDDFDQLKNVDWIIEVVPENVKIKQNLFERIDAIQDKVKVISSNTSGIPLKLLTADRSESFRKKFMVTHFFNPPRFMHLIETVCGPETDKDLFESVNYLLEHRLGKGVVECLDTPNFIANRIGCFDFLAAINAMQKHGLSISEVDAIAGTPCGRPKTAVFRLLDMIGIDTICHVIENMHEMLPKDEFRELLKVPDFIKTMVEKGLVGSKAGQGFYKKDKAGILTLNIETFEYEAPKAVDMPILKEVKRISCTRERVHTLCSSDSPAGKFAKDYLVTSGNYAAFRIPEIASTPVNIDRAMNWGYNHEVGPFTTLDAIGLNTAKAHMDEIGLPIPPFIQSLIDSGKETIYQVNKDSQSSWSAASKSYQEVPKRFGDFNLEAKKTKETVIGGNDSLSEIALEDDILFIELHGKQNAFSMRVVEALTHAVDKAQEKFKAVVIGTQIDTFSVGADLTEMIGAAQTGDMKVLQKAIQNFQTMSMTIRHSSIPVVSALTGYTFGGGCEVAMHCDARQSAPNTWMGLVEAGVGILPAGGGCKEFARIANLKAGPKGDLFEPLFELFQTIAMAKVTGSAYEMPTLGFGGEMDGISQNKETLISDAVKRAKLMADQG
ncbi:MAG: 3-hydroxyacyl-CoA dehydrogenase NAD-binding domain-containing protein, partial [Lentisphaeraceae bacterium]|nr:3-hydroxyacyl-CoA dehydrogenase NAD-binding domain-containing protein [Lentisphaeraceae bacterium]